METTNPNKALAEYNAEVDRQNAANGITPERYDAIHKALIAGAIEFEEKYGSEEARIVGTMPPLSKTPRIG